MESQTQPDAVQQARQTLQQAQQEAQREFEKGYVQLVQRTGLAYLAIPKVELGPGGALQVTAGLQIVPAQVN